MAIARCLLQPFENGAHLRVSDTGQQPIIKRDIIDLGGDSFGTGFAQRCRGRDRAGPMIWLWRKAQPLALAK